MPGHKHPRTWNSPHPFPSGPKMSWNPYNCSSHLPNVCHRDHGIFQDSVMGTKEMQGTKMKSKDIPALEELILAQCIGAFTTKHSLRPPRCQACAGHFRVTTGVGHVNNYKVLLVSP